MLPLPQTTPSPAAALGVLGDGPETMFQQGLPAAEGASKENVRMVDAKDGRPKDDHSGFARLLTRQQQTPTHTLVLLAVGSRRNIASVLGLQRWLWGRGPGRTLSLSARLAAMTQAPPVMPRTKFPALFPSHGLVDSPSVVIENRLCILMLPAFYLALVDGQSRKEKHARPPSQHQSRAGLTLPCCACSLGFCARLCTSQASLPCHPAFLLSPIDSRLPGHTAGGPISARPVRPGSSEVGSPGM